MGRGESDAGSTFGAAWRGGCDSARGARGSVQQLDHRPRSTGKLAWYYQHLPGDDADLDYTNERVLVRTRVNPDPKFVKWINPGVPQGQERDIAVTIGEGGGIWALDRSNGQFSWANPFPFDAPEFAVADIDGKTGRTKINWDIVFKSPGERHVVCYWNAKSYWPMAYSPETNSIYSAYIDNCRDRTTAGPNGRGSWKVVQRPGGDPNALTGLAKIDMATGWRPLAGWCFTATCRAASGPSTRRTASRCGKPSWAEMFPSAPSVTRRAGSSISRS